MKKLLICALAALFCLSAHAQLYVGGGIKVQSGDPTTVAIAPEVGYSFNEHWAVGGVLGFSHFDYLNVFEISPYARFTFLDLGPAKLFVDGGLSVAIASPKGGDDFSAFEIGVKPGIAIPLTENLSFVGHVGFLGFTDNDDGVPGYGDGFGFSLSGNNFTAGLYYSF